MANQPKKYKKFVATAATATLVASAIVPVASAASFSDVDASNSHAEAINALVSEGIINGYQDGTFKPNGTLTRGHVVKMLGKWVEAQGFAVPADWNTVARFSDLAVNAVDQELVKYAAVVKDAGVFNGSNGELNARGSITRENMALTLDRAYAAVFGQSLVEEAAGLQNITVSDLATAKEESRAAIQALRNLGVSNVDTFNPKAAVTRAQFASFLYRTINVEGNQTTPPTGEVAIASLKATGVSELTVEFNQAVDTEAAAFAVKQGSSSDVKVSEVKWNAANTVATLTVDHKFVDATYNLTVTGVAEEALTASVTTTKEVATEIKFNSDKLVLTGKKDAGEDAVEARITFEVYNQYGKEITNTVPDSYYDRLKLKGIDTKTPNGVAGVSTELYFDTQNKGTIVAWIDKREKEGETGSISFTYEFGDVEIDVEQDIVLSDDMEPGSVTFEKEIFSVNGYEFNAKNVEKYGQVRTGDSTQKEFYVLFSVKDQYGNPITAKNADREFLKGTSGDTILTVVADGLRLSVSEDEIFDLDERYTEVKNVDGKYYFAIPLEFEFTREGYVEQTGENTVSIRSKATGTVDEAKFNLEGSSKIYSIGLSAPDKVVASNETVQLPVSVVDATGQEITDVALLNKSLKPETVDGKVFEAKLKVSGDRNNNNVTFVKKDGKVFLEFKSIVNDDDKKSKDMDIEIEVLDTRQESEITLKVQPRAYATTLVKIKDGKSTSYFTGEDFDLKLSDFVVEDQYGRVFDEVTKDYTIVAKKTSDSSTPVTMRNGVAGDAEFATVVDGEAVIGTTSDDATKIKFDAGSSKGSATYEFKLVSQNNSTDANRNTITSTISTTFRVVDQTGFDSYKVKGESLVYGTVGADGEVDSQDNGKADVAELKVYGVIGNREVLLPTTEYVVRAKDYVADATVYTAGQDKAKIAMTTKGAWKLQDDKVSTFKTGVEIVISRTGEVIKQELTLSNAKPEFAKISIEDAKSVSGKDLTELTVTTRDIATVGGLLDQLFDTTQVKKVTVATQYGQEFESDVKLKDANGNVLLDADGNEIYETTALKGDFLFTISNVNATNDNYKIVANGSQLVQVTQGANYIDSFDLTIKLDNAIKTIKVRVK